MLRLVMPRARLRQWPLLGVVFAAGAAIVPVAAMASGEAIPTGDGTTTGAVVGGIAVAAVGGLVAVAKSLAGRGSNGPSRSSTRTDTDAQQSVQLAELRTEQRHLAQQVSRHASLHDRTRDDLADAVRALDQLGGRLDTVDERLSDVLADVRSLLAELRSRDGQG